MIGLVVVSHSRALAESAVDLASQMVSEDQRPPIRVAAGLDEHTLGTDAAAVSQAIEELADTDGVLILVDLGSAVLSAEMACEFVDPELAARVVISPAPIVEGLVAAVVTASSGASVAEVDREARASLAAKTEHLGDEQAVPPEPQDTVVAGPADQEWELVLHNPHGLHARPAAALVGALRGLDAQVSVANATTGSPLVDARSVSAVAGLQLRQGQTMKLRASGPQAAQARSALEELAAADFGDETEQHAPQPVPDTGPVRGPVRIIHLEPDLGGYRAGSPDAEQQRFDKALQLVREHLEAAAEGPLPAVFHAQAELLADPVIARGVGRRIRRGSPAPDAVRAVLDETAASFDRLDDPYLRERGQDVRSLRRLLLIALAAAPWNTGMDVAPGIWVLPELDAATAAGLDTSRCAAIVTTSGGDTGHGAMVARSRGIPLLLGMPEAAALADAEQVEIDPAARRLVRLAG